MNQTYYAVQLASYGISSDLATSNGWTQPTGVSWTIPTTLTFAQFVISTNNFGTLVGYNAGTTFPTSQTGSALSQQTTLSPNSPQITNFATLLMSCNLVSSPLVIPSGIIYQFNPTTVAFGSLYTSQIVQPIKASIRPGVYGSFLVRITDQYMADVTILDPNICITLEFSLQDQTPGSGFR